MGLKISKKQKYIFKCKHKKVKQKFMSLSYLYKKLLVCFVLNS